MARYYYTDPVKAIWMIRNFNFKLQQTYDDHETFERVGDGDIANELFEHDPQENWLHPDCHEMLKPQVGDLCELKGNPDYDHYDLTWEKIIRPSEAGGWHTDNSEFKPGMLEQYLHRIIQRDNKAWFTPEVEGD